MRAQEFEKAGELRDKEMELKAKIEAIVADKKAVDKAEVESAEGAGPEVTEADIANIVAQWTGIPVEKVSADETGRLYIPSCYLATEFSTTVTCQLMMATVVASWCARYCSLRFLSEEYNDPPCANFRYK